MFGLGPWEMVMILVVALLVIGPAKLPEVAKSLGRTLRDLQRTANDFNREIVDEVNAAARAEPKPHGEPAPPAADHGHETRPEAAAVLAEPTIRPAPDAIAIGSEPEDRPTDPYAKLAAEDHRWQLQMALDSANAPPVETSAPATSAPSDAGSTDTTTSTSSSSD